MSRISIDIGETGGRTNLAIQKQILCVTDKVIGRERKLIVHKGKVNTDICLLIGFPFQVGINFFLLGDTGTVNHTRTIKEPVHCICRRQLCYGQVGTIARITGLSPSGTQLQVTEQF